MAVDSLENGKIYAWVGDSDTIPNVWSGDMKYMLDGEPRKFISYFNKGWFKGQENKMSWAWGSEISNFAVGFSHQAAAVPLNQIATVAPITITCSTDMLNSIWISLHDLATIKNIPFKRKVYKYSEKN